MCVCVREGANDGETESVCVCECEGVKGRKKEGLLHCVNINTELLEIYTKYSMNE